MDLRGDTAVREPQSTPLSHVGWAPVACCVASRVTTAGRNGSPFHEGKAGMLGCARPVLALPGRQRGGRGPVPEAEELVRGQLPPAVDKIFWQKKRLLKIQGKIWSRRIPVFTVDWKFLGSFWTFTQVEFTPLDLQKWFQDKSSLSHSVYQHLFSVNKSY